MESPRLGFFFSLLVVVLYLVKSQDAEVHTTSHYLCMFLSTAPTGYLPKPAATFRYLIQGLDAALAYYCSFSPQSRRMT